MTEHTVNFLLRRLQQENSLADLARCEEAREAHRSMARLYAQQVLQQVHNAGEDFSVARVGLLYDQARDFA